MIKEVEIEDIGKVRTLNNVQFAREPDEPKFVKLYHQAIAQLH